MIYHYLLLRLHHDLGLIHTKLMKWLKVKRKKKEKKRNKRKKEISKKKKKKKEQKGRKKITRERNNIT
jgi:hypothetical protein